MTDVLPSSIESKYELAEALKALKDDSSYSFRTLARQVDAQPATVSGWFSGRHLPYPRHDETFHKILIELGVDDTQAWDEALARARQNSQDSASSNPYQGLDPYAQAESHRFFGRDSLTDELFQHVTDRTPPSPRDTNLPVVLLGPSGSGKTSLLRAGLLPRIANTGDWHCDYLSLDDDPLHNVKRAVARKDRLTEPPVRLLVLDQFEQALRLPLSEQEHLFELLEAFCHQPDSIVLIGLRADYFQAASMHPWLRAGLSEHQVLMRPPSVEDLTDIVIRSAHVVNRTVENALLGTMISAVNDYLAGRPESGALPHVSHVLFGVAEASTTAELTLAAYNKVGGFHGALSKSAEDAYAGLTDAEQRACRRLFSSLVQLSAQGIPTRRLLHEPELERIVDDEIEIEPVLLAFTASRIIITDQDTIRLSHEAVLTTWQRLGAWIEEDRSHLIGERRVKVAAELWRDSGKDPDSLLSGSALGQANEMLEAPFVESRLDDDTLQFVELSGAQHRRRLAAERKRRRVLIGLTSLAGTLALVASMLAVRSERSADEARRAEAESRSRQIAAQAQIFSNSDPTVKHHLGLLAFDIYPSTEARSALIGGTGEVQSRRYLGGSGSTALGVAGDGSRFAYSNSADGTIRVMDQTSENTFSEVFRLEVQDADKDVYALAFSRDGRYMLSGGQDSFVSLWDLEGDRKPRHLHDDLTYYSAAVLDIELDETSGFAYGAGLGNGVGIWNLAGSPEEESLLIPESEIVEQVELHPDTALALLRLNDGTIKAWDLTDLAEPLWTRPPPDDKIVNAIAVRPDGTQLLIGDSAGTIEFFDIRDYGRPTFERELQAFGGWVNAIRYSPDGRSIVSTASNGEVAIWEAASLNERGRTVFPALGLDIEFVDDTRLLVAVADGSVRELDLADVELSNGGAQIWTIQFAQTRKRMIAASGDQVQILDLNQNGKSVLAARIAEPTGLELTGAAAISPSGETVAMGSRSGEVLLALPASPTRYEILDELGAHIENVSISDDGTLLGAVDRDGRAFIWRLGAELDARPKTEVAVEGWAISLAFSPDNSQLLVGSDTGAVSVFSLREPGPPELTGKVISGDSIAFTIDFHPTLPIFATGNSDSSVRLWESTHSGDPDLVGMVDGPHDRVFWVAFSPDGERIAATSSDGVAWVWSFDGSSSPQLQLAIPTTSDDLHALAFSPDSSELVAGGAEGQLFHWDLNVTTAQQRICDASGESITEAEWAELLPDTPYSPPCAN